jgi:hypothetical protein
MMADNGLKALITEQMWAFSITSQLYCEISNWRSEYIKQHPEKAEHCLAKFTAGLAYALLPFIALIEMIFRAAIGLLLLPGLLIPSVKDSNFYKKYLFASFILGAVWSAGSITEAAVANYFNIAEDGDFGRKPCEVSHSDGYHHLGEQMVDYARSQA